MLGELMARMLLPLLHLGSRDEGEIKKTETIIGAASGFQSLLFLYTTEAGRKRFWLARCL